MKLTLAAGLLAFALCLTSAVPGRAQSPTPPTPTTRILAIGTGKPGADVALRAPSCRWKCARR